LQLYHPFNFQFKHNFKLRFSLLQLLQADLGGLWCLEIYEKNVHGN
jgi:hypothetical protein